MTKLSDQEIIDRLDKAEEYLVLRKKLHSVIRDGFLSLAQTKYAIGPQNVTSLQYPTSEMNAQTLVRINDDRFEVERTCDDGLNPIKWFSVIPPNSLKAAQGHFINSVGLVTQLANITKELMETNFE